MGRICVFYYWDIVLDISKNPREGGQMSLDLIIFIFLCLVLVFLIYLTFKIHKQAKDGDFLVGYVAKIRKKRRAKMSWWEAVLDRFFDDEWTNEGY